MGIIVNRRRVMGGKSLPYDAEIEYLESSGTQYINTGVYGTESLKTELCVQELRKDPGVAIFGNFTTDGCYYLYQAGGSNNMWQVGFRGWSNTGVQVDTGVHIFLFDNFKVYIDGVLMSTFGRGSFTTSAELLLFNMSGWNYRSVPKRVYYCKMWNNGVLIHNFIPVRVGRVGYMYDKVSKQLFGNAGTGSFILGFDKGAKNININVKTHSIGGSDASLDVTTGYGEPVNILYTTVMDTSWTNKYIQVKYTLGSVGWQIYAITSCLYDGQVYNSGELIANWVYTETKDMTIIANI